MDDAKFGSRNDKGDWKPSNLWSYGPLFDFPTRPFKILKWIFSYPGFIFPWIFFYGLFGLIIWLFFTPSMETVKNLNASWIIYILIRNFLIIFCWFGFLHLRLYIKKDQGNAFKYNNEFLHKNSKPFLFGKQTYDNMFWTLCSGVPIWTAYEVFTLWNFANGNFTYVNWQDNIIYCILLLFLLPIWENLHFYLGHRFLHAKFLYKYAHHVHHKNVNPGPWSGLSMHTIEHIIFFSSPLIFFILPAHPIHAFYLWAFVGLAPAVHGHSGFDKFVAGKKVYFDTGGYNHYLHHKYFECNYADGALPLDKWFGTFHDGSDEAQKKMIQRMKERQPNII